MALFGKKSSDSSPGASAPGTTTAPAKSSAKGSAKTGAKSGLFGRGKKGADAPAAPSSPANGAGAPGATDTGFGFDDFSDFSAPSPELSRAPVATTRARPKVLNGTAIGLNIGNATIKAVELRASGGTIKVTGAAMVHTPLESLSNGVIMSQGSLSHAIKSAIQDAGIKSRAVTTAVAGTGSIVVRVVEMPRMSDAELAETMKTDAEKFIPFAPEEVRLDFRPLRELPSPPDSPNMDVLIAAAQREVLYQYGDVLKAAKLAPRAIEVEPLAVARTISHSSGGAEVDYARVTAAINIGASATEISVLRGDVLVFTRTLPSGGNALTQALVDYLGLSESEAERVKQEFGDALPSFQASQPTGASSQVAGGGFTDDWSNLDFDTDTPAAPVTAAAVPTSDFGAQDITSVTVVSPSSTSGASTASSTASDDPFDPNFFAQGPEVSSASASSTDVSLQKDAGEQHGQQQDDPNPKPGAGAFDFSSFDFDDAPADASADAPAPSAVTNPNPTVPGQNAEAVSLAEPGEPSTATSGFNFDFDVPDATPTATPTATPDVTIAAPQTVDIPPPASGDTSSTVISFAKPSTSTSDDAGASSALSSAPSTSGASLDDNAFNFSFDDVGIAASSATPEPTRTSTTASTAPLPDADADVPNPSSATPTSSTLAPTDSSFDFDFPQDVASTPSTSSAAMAPTASAAAADLDFGAGPIVSDATMSVIPAEDASAWGLDDLTAPVGGTPVAGAPVGTSVGAAPVSLGKAPDASAADDFDLDAIFNAPAGGAVAGAGVGGVAVGAGAAAVDDPFSVGSGMDDFGAGLTNDIAPGVDAPTVYSILHPLLDELAGEIRRSLEYHASRYPEAVVQSIELVGGGAKLRNLDAFLTQSLGIPASVGDPMRNLGGDISAQTRADSPAYAVAVGLALRELLA